MSNAYLDENGRPTLTATLQDDGVTIVKVTANSTRHALSVDDDITGSDAGNNEGNANLDQNSRPVLTALSSDGDGSVVEIYSDSDGNLLIDSN